jgi:hypothetical protein
MLNTEKISQLVDSTTSVVSNAVTQAVSSVIATSSRYYSSTTTGMNNIYGRSSNNEKSMAVVSILSYGLVTLTSSLLLVQYGTSADPIGRCFLFLKQLRRQVNKYINILYSIHSCNNSFTHSLTHQWCIFLHTTYICIYK